jgi:hydroxymethylpyrimidine/phosphomethylpyrimidine kinase
MVRLQLEAVFAELPPGAAKTGMLYSRAIIEVVAEFLIAQQGLPVVVDPVMVATSGAVLLQPSAIAAVRRLLLPRAMLVTPNLDEARLLTRMSIEEPEDMRQAARSLHETYGCAALIKGGHLEGREAVDVLYDGREEFLLSAPRVMGVSSHGTGCTYSAAITAHLARGMDLRESVCRAKDTITQALTGSRKVGKHSILGPWSA